VQRQHTSKNRESALYNFIYLHNKGRNLPELNGNVVFKERTLDSGQDGSYFLIQVDTKKIDHPYQSDGFAIKESHLRIDKNYVLPSSNTLTTHWHFTLNYIKSNDPQQKRTIRVYFHHCLQLKAIAENEEGQKADVTEEAMLQQLNILCKSALVIAETLLNSLKQRQTVLENEFSTKSTYFESLSELNDVTPKVLTAKLLECEKIASELRKYNEDASDKRINFLKSRVESIIAARQQNNIVTDKSDSDLCETTATKTGEVKSKPSKKELKEANLVLRKQYLLQVDKLQSELETIITVLNGDNALAIISSQQQLEKLKNEIFVIWNQPLIKKDPSELLELNTKACSLPSSKDIFLRLVFSGKPEAAIILYENAAADLPVACFQEFLNTLADMAMDPILELKYVRLCTFLFERNDSYRLNLSLIYATNMITVSKDGKVQWISYLARLAINEKIELFKLLYTQLNSKYINGFSFGERQISLFPAVAAFERKGDLLKFLLDSGEKCEFEHTQSTHKMSEVSSIKKIMSDSQKEKIDRIVSKFQSSSNTSYTELVKEATASLSVFYIVCGLSENFNILPELMAKTSIPNLVLGYFKLMYDSNLATMASRSDSVFNLFPDKTSWMQKIMIDQGQNGSSTSQNVYINFYFVVEDPQKLKIIMQVTRHIEKILKNLTQQQKQDLKMQLFNMYLTESKFDEFTKSHPLMVMIQNAILCVENFKDQDKLRHDNIINGLSLIIKSYEKSTVFTPDCAKGYAQVRSQWQKLSRYNEQVPTDEYRRTKKNTSKLS
jgi:hypothetical protein